MSQFETDRENQAVGPEICEECGHSVRLHGPDGCEGERCVQIEASSEHMWGPCGCEATTNEAPAFPSPLLAKHKLDVSWEDL